MAVEEPHWPAVSICGSYSFFPDLVNGRGCKWESLLLLGTLPDLRCYQKAAATAAWRPEQQPAASDDHLESLRESLAARVPTANRDRRYHSLDHTQPVHSATLFSLFTV